jgi:hypothetical protein
VEIKITRRQYSENFLFSDTIYARYTLDVDGREMQHTILISPEAKDDMLAGKFDETAIEDFKKNHRLVP